MKLLHHHGITSRISHTSHASHSSRSSHSRAELSAVDANPKLTEAVFTLLATFCEQVPPRFRDATPAELAANGELVGRRVEIFWETEDKFFPAKIKTFSPDQDDATEDRFFVEYDNDPEYNDHEQFHHFSHNLRKSIWRIWDSRFDDCIAEEAEEEACELHDHTTAVVEEGAAKACQGKLYSLFLRLRIC